MKFKISFDKKSIGNLFLEHAEKAALGLFVLVFAAIIYGAVAQREKFDKDPKDLVDKSANARRSLAGERPERLNELLKNQQARDDKGDYKKVAGEIADFNKQGVSVKPYECPIALDKSLFGQKGKRGQPELVGAEELRAAADLGVFMVTENPAAAPQPGRPNPGFFGGPARTFGNAVPRGKHWVVITGLVPFEKQSEAYRNAFRDALAYDPANDVPAYVDFNVQRAEINSPADDKNPNFSKIFAFTEAVKETTKDWSQTLPEVVDSKCVDSAALTFPLGPLQNRQWSENVAHDKIPLLNPYGTRGDAIDGDNAGRNGNPSINRAEEAARRDPRLTQGRQVRPGNDSNAVGYKLLRFFDFTVEPGKSYKYKMCLVLKNPNYGIDPGKLEKADFAKEKTLSTPFSDPTARIDVPKDTQVLVGAAKPDDLSPGKFPVVLLTWVKRTGRSGYYPLSTVDRGQVLNFSNVKIDPVLETPSPATPDTEDIKSDLISDAVVLDMDGGNRLVGKDRKLTAPRDLLLMVLNGKTTTLMIRDEMDDSAEVNRVTTKPETGATQDFRTPEKILLDRGGPSGRTPPRPR
jgi:hypothetical protein